MHARQRQEASYVVATSEAIGFKKKMVRRKNCTFGQIEVETDVEARSKQPSKRVRNERQIKFEADVELSSKRTSD